MILSTESSNSLQPAIKQELTSIQHLKINDDQTIREKSPENIGRQDQINNNKNQQDKNPDITKVESETETPVRPASTKSSVAGPFPISNGTSSSDLPHSYPSLTATSNIPTTIASMIMQQIQPEPQNLHISFDRHREKESRDRDDADTYREHIGGKFMIRPLVHFALYYPHIGIPHISIFLLLTNILIEVRSPKKIYVSKISTFGINIIWCKFFNLIW